MSTACLTSKYYRGSSGYDYTRDRERMNLIQKRLELEKERINLDRDILDAEKANFEKYVKLAAKRNNRTSITEKSGTTEQYRKQFCQQQDEIENLRAQLKATRNNKECRELAENSNVGIASIHSSSEEQNLRIQQLESELLEAKTMHKSLEKDQVVEKQKWESEKHELVQNRLRQYTAVSSLKDEVKRIGVLLENSQGETERLREENFRLKQSSKLLFSIASMNGTQSEHVEADPFSKLAEKFKVLREERDMLKQQLRDQSRQIDDWKLLLPRNKALLDQALSKNEQLVKKLEDLQSLKQEEMRDSINNESELLVLQMKAQQTHHEDDEREEAIVDDMYTVSFDHLSSSTKELSTRTASPSNVAKFILIPSDFSAEDMAKRHNKFVIEWEWANRENKLGGLYTGWLDPEGNPNGGGTLRIDDGGIYIGEWKEGLRNGNGVYTSIDGAIYSGPWLNDRFQGRGVFVSETNQVYTGDWKDGRRHGSGIETWANGDCYTGYYHLDERNEDRSAGNGTIFDAFSNGNEPDKSSRKIFFHNSAPQEGN